MKNSVVIVGGSFVGCIAAILLTKLNVDVTIVEAKPFNFKKNADPRGIALNHASCELLKDLDLWPALNKHAQPIKTVHVSAKHTFSKVRFYAEDQGLDYLAHVIEGTHLLKTLIEHTTQFNNIKWIQPETVEAIKKDNDKIIVNLASKKILSPDLLIAADGQRSACRQLLGIQATSNTTQHALLTNITTSETHQSTAFERFTKQGTIALLPLSSQQYKCVISSNEKQIQDWQNLNDSDFITALQKQFGFFAGQFIKTGPRIHYPLTELSTDRQISMRSVLLGNAAHALHPIAAQGLNLAIQDIESLLELIKSALATQQAIGSTELLCAYEQQTKKNQARTQQLTNMLSKLHGGMINRSALALVANCPLLQAIIRKQAVGLS